MLPTPDFLAHLVVVAKEPNIKSVGLVKEDEPQVEMGTEFVGSVRGFADADPGMNMRPAKNLRQLRDGLPALALPDLNFSRLIR